MVCASPPSFICETSAEVCFLPFFFFQIYNQLIRFAPKNFAEKYPPNLLKIAPTNLYIPPIAPKNSSNYIDDLFIVSLFWSLCKLISRNRYLLIFPSASFAAFRLSHLSLPSLIFLYSGFPHGSVFSSSVVSLYFPKNDKNAYLLPVTRSRPDTMFGSRQITDVLRNKF